MKQKADDLPPGTWQELQRPARYEISSRPRVRPEAVKEQIVQRREYQNIRLMGEQVAEFDYRPTKCRKSYRMVVVRKNLSVEKGHQRLFEKYRYFFYITNDRQKSAADVVFFANDRCNQENIIEQLKNGVHALRLPPGDLVSNWAYMVIAGLAWNLKSWYGLMQATGQGRQTILKMEFRRFLLDYMQLPCQIVTGGRRILYRLLSYTTGLHDFFDTWARIQVSTFP